METANTQENKKNILFIVQNASYPFDKRVSKEAVSLNKNGFKVYVISPTSVYDVESFSNIGGIEIHRFKNYLSNGSFIGFFLEYFISLIKIYSLSVFLFLKKKINVIHVANPPDFFWPLAIISKILRIKFIFDQHDLAPEMFNIRFSSRLVYRILTFNEKLTVALADSIITANNSFKKRLITKYKIESEKCIVAYNGPEENFEPIECEPLVNKFNNKKVILYVGLMTITDNIEIVIEVAKKIIKEEKRDDCLFVLLGDGDVRRNMEELSKQYAISENVLFVGMVDYENVMQYLYVADVCIAPDLPNGLNEYLTLIKILEYMKSKKAFVAFDLAETKYMAEDSGLYANDIIDYKNKILHLIDHPNEAKKLGEKGYSIIMNKYLWNQSEKNILQLYTKLLRD